LAKRAKSTFYVAVLANQSLFRCLLKTFCSLFLQKKRINFAKNEKYEKMNKYKKKLKKPPLNPILPPFSFQKPPLTQSGGLRY
jgi:hypothetical protein